jgi:hypothetical protein
MIIENLFFTVLFWIKRFVAALRNSETSSNVAHHAFMASIEVSDYYQHIKYYN